MKEVFESLQHLIAPATGNDAPTASLQFPSIFTASGLRDFARAIPVAAHVFNPPSGVPLRPGRRIPDGKPRVCLISIFLIALE